MGVGRNLADILQKQGLSNKEFIEEIDISPNTLTNIINEKTKISPKVKCSILNFLKEHGISEAELYKEKIQIPNIRIRVNSELAGNEKANMQNAIIDFENKIEILKILEDKLCLLEYFSMYESPDYDVITRKEKLLELIEEKGIKTPVQLVIFLYSDEIKDLLYIDPIFPISSYSIPRLLETLGIRIIFKSFGTDKIISFSTSLFENRENTNWIPPTIFLNDDVCNTTEKTYFYMAVEFWFMLMKQNEYSELDSYKPMVEPLNSDAIIFAENLLVPKDFLKFCIEKDKTFKYRSLYDKVDILKNHFNVSYELILKRLFELKYLQDFASAEFAKQEYLTQVKAFYKEMEESLPIKHGEPNPLPLTLRGTDFYECAIIAAWEKGLKGFSDNETMHLLNSDKKSLEKKSHNLNYLINDIITQ